MAKDNKQDSNSKESPRKETKQEAVKNVFAQGDISIGDITQTINQYTQKREIEFLKHTNLKKFQSPYFPRLTRLDETLDNIQKHHISVLGGSHADKSDLAWHFAIHLQLSIWNSNVYGWESASNTRELIAAIREESSVTASIDKESVKIFVLLNLDPQDVTLDALKKLASEYKIFIIATTESPQEKWSLSQAEKRSWLDSNSLSYEPKVLAQAAIARIPEGIILSFEMQAELRRLVVEQLHTVADIDACIDWLKNCKQAISLNDIDAA